MGSRRWLGAGVGVVLALGACGSRGPIYDDPFRGRDAGLGPDVLDAGVDASGDAGVRCEWEDVSDRLTGAGIQVFAVDPRDPGGRRLYGASATRLYRSEDAGRTWTFGQQLPARTLSLAFPSVGVLLGTADGVWLTLDEGETFEQLSLAGLTIHSLEAHATDRDRVFAAVHSLGVLRSNDGGQSWSPTSGGLESATNVVRFSSDPRSLSSTVAGTIANDPMFFGYSLEGALVRTADGGATWSTIDATGGRLYDLARCAADPDILYAARFYGLYRSTDGGNTFAPIADLSGPPGELPATSPASVDVGGDRCERVVVLMGTPTLATYVSEDGGESFAGPQLDGLGVSRLTRGSPLLRYSGGGVVAGTDTGFYLSPDGRTFVAVGGIHEVSVSTLHAANGSLWAGTSGAGTWVVGPGETSWTNIPISELENAYVFSILPLGAATRTTGDVLIGSYGSLYGRFDGEPSFHVVPNDHIEADNVFDFAVLDDGTILTASQTEAVQRSEDGGRSFHFSIEGFVPWDTPSGFGIDLRAITTGPPGSGTVIAGSAGRGLWRSDDRGRTWRQTGLRDGTILAVERVESLDLYVAALAGSGVVVSRDGESWTAANDGLESLDAQYLATDGGDVVVNVGGRIHRTRDPESGWMPIDADCGLGRGGALAILSRTDGRWLYVAGDAHGVRRHRL